MESKPDFRPQAEFKINSPEILFRKLAENTGGVLAKVDDPEISRIIPFIINYPEKQQAVEEDFVRVYRGIRTIPSTDCSQLPSILKTDKISKKLIQLTYELADDPSFENYRKVKKEYKRLGNDISSLDDAESYVQKYIEETGGGYSDGFKCMHNEKNYASPYVSASGDLRSALFYAGVHGNTNGVIIIADIPKDRLTYDFYSGFDEEISIKGILKQEYIKSALLFQPQENFDYQQTADKITQFIKA